MDSYHQGLTPFFYLITSPSSAQIQQRHSSVPSKTPQQIKRGQFRDKFIITSHTITTIILIIIIIGCCPDSGWRIRCIRCPSWRTFAQIGPCERIDWGMVHFDPKKGQLIDDTTCYHLVLKNCAWYNRYNRKNYVCHGIKYMCHLLVKCELFDKWYRNNAMHVSY